MIDWDDVPEWVQWVTVDSSGRCYGWYHEPVRSKTAWWVNSVSGSAELRMDHLVLPKKREPFVKWQRPQSDGK